MKTRKHSKIITLFLALAMTLAMGTSVFAAPMESDGSVITSGKTTKDGSLAVKKVVVVQNELTNKITIAYPAMSFTYEVEPATVSDTKVKGYKLDQTQNLYKEDTSGYVQSAVKAGPDGGLTESDVAIAAGTATLNAKGYQAVTGDLNFSTDITKFNAPGIYRYKLTDTTPEANLTNVGLVRANSVDKEYFVDVYVGKNPDATNLEVYGFVLIKSNPSEINKQNNTNMSAKSWIIGDVALTDDYKIADDTTVTEANNDMYYTYNVELSKKVTGTMGDTAHEFPFGVTVANETKNSQSLKFILNETDDATVATSVNQDSGNFGVTLSDSDVAKFIGLNPWTTVKYTETNDTDSVYTVTVKNGKDSAETGIDITGNATLIDSKTREAEKTKTVIAYENPAKQVTTYSVYSAKGEYNDAHFTEFTNDLAAISPTNVVMRFAPYLFILGGAVLLIFASRRRKAEQE